MLRQDGTIKAMTPAERAEEVETIKASLRADCSYMKQWLKEHCGYLGRLDALMDEMAKVNITEQNFHAVIKFMRISGFISFLRSGGVYVTIEIIDSPYWD